MKSSISVNGRQYISASRAAEISKYSRDYIGQLCRAGKIPATLVLRSWFVDLDALIVYKDLTEKNLRAYSQQNAKTGETKPFAPEPFVAAADLDASGYIYSADSRPLLPTIAKKTMPAPHVQVRPKARATVRPSEQLGSRAPVMAFIALFIFIGASLVSASYPDQTWNAASDALTAAGRALTMATRGVASISGHKEAVQAADEGDSASAVVAAAASSDTAGSASSWWPSISSKVTVAVRHFLGIADAQPQNGPLVLGSAPTSSVVYVYRQIPLPAGTGSSVQPTQPVNPSTVVYVPSSTGVSDSRIRALESGLSYLTDQVGLLQSSQVDQRDLITQIVGQSISNAFRGFMGGGGTTIVNNTGGGGSGSVTSVDANGGTTGLTFTGGPVTTTGTLTMSGTLGIANGGTALASAPTYGQLLLGNSSGGYDLVATSTLGLGGSSGTVSSVDANGGTTGLTFSGGPVTSSGTLTLGGKLSVANGGTGWTSVAPGAILYGNGSGALSTTTSATAGQVLSFLNGVPSWTSTTTAGTGLTYSGGAFNVNTSQNIAQLSNLGTNGFVKTSGADGTLIVDTNTYLTANQTVTLTGDITGSGATSITTAYNNIVPINKGGTNLGSVGASSTILVSDGTILKYNKLSPGNFTTSNISQWTNDAGYLTSLTGAASSTLLSDNNSFSGKNNFTYASTTAITAQSANIARLDNLTSAGFVKTSANGTLSVDTSTYLTSLAGAASSTLLADNNSFTGTANNFVTRLGVGTSSPSNLFAFDVQGNGLFSGNVSLANLTATGTISAATLNLTNALTIGNGGTGLQAIGASSTLLASNGTSLVYQKLSPGNFTSTNVSQWTNDAGYATNASLASAYPFGLPGNATSTKTQFNGGLTAFASSTIGNGTQAGGLTINGGATTTGDAYFAGSVGIGTNNITALLNVGSAISAPPTGFAMVPSAYISTNYNGTGGVVMGNTSTGSSADFRFMIKDTTDHYMAFTQGGVNNSGGNLFGLSRGSGDFILSNGGTSRDMAIGPFASSDLILGTANTDRVHILSTGNVGIGTTSPSQNLSIQGNGLFSGNVSLANIAATGTLAVAGTGTSTFAGGVSVSQICLSGSPTTCLGGATGGAGTVTSVGTNNGLTGGTITNTGTIGLDLTGITANNSILTWNGSRLTATGTQSLSAPYFIGTSTAASVFPYASTTALTVGGSFYGAGLTDCIAGNKLIWSGGQFACAIDATGGGTGGGSWSTTTSSVAGQNVNYSNNSTDIVAVGGLSTTTAKFFFDPNTQIGYAAGKIGIGSTSPSTSFALGVQGNGLFSGNVSLANLTATGTISAATLNLTNALTIGNGGTGLQAIGASSTLLTSNGTSLVYQKLSPALFTSQNVSQWTNDAGYITNSSVLAAYPFTPTFNYAVNNNATTGIAWFQNGVNASSTSHFVYASTTAITAQSANIARLDNLTSAGFVKTSANGTLSVDTATYLTSLAGAASSTLLADNNSFTGTANNFVTRLGVGTSSPSSLFALDVQGSGLFSGNVSLANLTATGTLAVKGAASSTFTGPIDASNVCITGTTKCLSSQTSGTVTSVATNNGLTGGIITNSGTIGLDTSGIVNGLLLQYNGTKLTATGTQALTAGYYIATTSTASVLPYASSTALTATNLYATNLSLTNALTIGNGGTGLQAIGASSTLLTSNGTSLVYQKLSPALFTSQNVSQWTNDAGYATNASVLAAYPFPLAGNATSTKTQFNGGLTAFASSTIGNGTQAGGLTVNGGATTTGNAYFAGNVGIGTQPTADVLTVNGDITTTNGGNANVNFVIASGGVRSNGDASSPAFQGGTGNANGMYFEGNDVVFSSNSSETGRFTSIGLGIGTSSPYRQLSVGNSAVFGGNVLAASFTSTSTATSTFAGGISAARFCLTGSPTTCLGGPSASSTLLADNNSFTGTNKFNTGIQAFGSSTIGNGTQAGGLTVNGGATTTGNAYIGGDLETAGGVAADSLDVGASGAYIGGTLTVGNFSNILLNAGSAIVANSQVGVGFTSGTAVDLFTAGGTGLRVDSNANVGIGTSSPYRQLSVGNSAVFGDNVLAASFTATSTTATSTFAGGIDAARICITGTTKCLNNQTSGTVTSVATNNGLTGGTITGAGTIGLDLTGITANNSILTWNGSRLTATGTQSLSAPYFIGTSSIASIFPYASTTALTATNAYATNLTIAGLTGSTQCLRVDATGKVSGSGSDCGSGGSLSTWATTTSSVAGQNVNAPLVSSDIVSVGSNSTTSAAFFFDPNAQLGYISGKLGIGTASPSEKLDVAGNINVSTGSSYKLNGVNIATGVTALSDYFFGGAGGTGNTGTDNIGVGLNALRLNTSGAKNIALGTNALGGSDSGSSNVAIGYQSLFNNFDGSGNVALGENTLTQNVSGANNTVVGYTAGNNVTGGNNTLIGAAVGQNLTTGSNNIAIGYNINTPAAGSANTLNVGNLLYGTGVDGSGSTLSSGSIGIGTTTPSQKLSIQGNGLFSGNVSLANLTATGTISAATLNLTNALTIGNGGTGLQAIGASSTVLLSNGTGLAYQKLSPGNFTSTNVSQWTNDAGYATTGSVLSAYPFPLAGNATSTKTQFNGGLTAFASSTIGNGTQAGGLTVNGGATTTGGAYIAGNVGIGVVSPTQALDVNGNVNASGYAIAQGIAIGGNNGVIFNGSVNNGQISVFNSNFLGLGWGSDPILGVLNTGKVGVGTTTPGSSFAVQGNGLFSGNVAVASLTATGTSKLTYASTTAITAQSANILRLDNLASAGFVKTSANGTLSVDTSTYLTSLAGAASSTLLADNNSFTGNDFFKNNLGLGTTSPTSALGVQGNGLFSGNVSLANLTATGTISAATLNLTNALTIGNGGTGLNAIGASSTLLTSNGTSLVYQKLSPALFTSQNVSQWTNDAGYLTAATASAYPFGLPGNATSTKTQFNGGLTAFASSTIGNGTQAGGLTINGGATTTGNAYFGNDVTVANNVSVSSQLTASDISSYSGTISRLQLLSTDSPGWSGPQLGFGSFTESFDSWYASTTATSLAFGTTPDFVNLSEKFTLASNGNVGVGTSTPYRQLSVGNSAVFGGNVLAASFTATSTATSTFAGGIDAARVCITGTTTCLNPAGTSASSTLLADNNTFSGTNKFNNVFSVPGTGTSTFTNGLQSGTFALTGAGAGCAQFTAGGFLSSTGTACGAGGSSFAYPFTLANNYGANEQATTGIAWFQNGLNASSTSHFVYASTTALTSFGSAYFALNGGAVGIGTSSPYRQLSVAGGAVFGDDVTASTFTATSTTATSTFAGGLDVGNGGLAYDFTSGITSIASARIGTLNFDTDAGVVSWTDLPVSAAPAGTVESYTASLAGNPAITVFGTSTGSGNVNGVSVGIGTTTPSATLAVQGSGLFSGNLSLAALTATGTLTVSGVGTSTFTNGLQAASIALSGASAGCAQFTAGGFLSSTGTACGAGGGSSFAYPFALAGNATSTLTQFNGGLTAFASSTIGDGTQTGGLVVNGGATTTGNAYIAGTVGVGIQSPASTFDVRGTADVIQSADAVNLFLYNPSLVNSQVLSLTTAAGNSVSNGRALTIDRADKAYSTAVFYTDSAYGLGLGSGDATRDVFLGRSAANTLRISSDAANGDASLIVNGSIGIATTSPYRQLSVGNSAVFGGDVTAATFTATSTATSTFAGGIDVARICITGTATCLGSTVGGSSASTTLLADNNTFTGTNKFNNVFSVLGTGTSTFTNGFQAGSIALTGASAGCAQFGVGGFLSSTGSACGSGGGGSSFAYPFTLANNYGANEQATTGIAWFQNGVNASSTSHFVYASTTAISAVSLAVTGTGTTTITGGISAARICTTGVICLGSTGTVASAVAGQLAFYSANGSTLVGSSTASLTMSRYIATGTIASSFLYASTTALTSSGSVYLGTGGTGSVGIGATSTPWGQLSVNSNGIKGPSFVIGSSTATAFVVTNAGNIGVGDASPDFRFESVGASGFGYLGISSSAISTEGDIFKIDNSGLVGIGTSSPYAALSVAGASGVVANVYAATSTTATSTFAGGLVVGDNGLAYDFTSGITSIASARFGALNFDTDAGAVSWADLPVSAASAGTPESYTAFLAGNPAITVYGTSTGSGNVTSTNVGIATTSPWRTLAVNGTVSIAGLTGLAGVNGNALCLAGNGSNEVVVNSGQTCTLSSQRYKHDISSSDSGLATVMALRPVTFYYNADTKDTDQQFGFIAEEVNTVDPRLVSLDKDGKPQTVRYEEFTAVLAKAIQEQQVQLTSLQAQATSTANALANLAASVGAGSTGGSSTTVIVQQPASTTGTTATSTSTSTPDMTGTVFQLAASVQGLRSDVTDLQAQAASTSLALASSTPEAVSMVLASSTQFAGTLASSTPFIQTIASAVQSFIQSAGEWVLSKITATLAIFNRVETQTAAVTKGLEMTDQATGQIYCVVIRNGDFAKTPGSCDAATSTPSTGTGTTTPQIVPAAPAITIVTPPAPSTGTTTATSTGSTAAATSTASTATTTAASVPTTTPSTGGSAATSTPSSPIVTATSTPPASTSSGTASSTPPATVTTSTPPPATTIQPVAQTPPADTGSQTQPSTPPATPPASDPTASAAGTGSTATGDSSI